MKLCFQWILQLWMKTDCYFFAQVPKERKKRFELSVRNWVMAGWVREYKIEKFNHFFLANPGRMQLQFAINWNRLPLSLAFLNSFSVLLFLLHENTMSNYSNKVRFNNKNRTHACLNNSASKFCEKKKLMRYNWLMDGFWYMKTTWYISILSFSVHIDGIHCVCSQSVWTQTCVFIDQQKDCVEIMKKKNGNRKNPKKGDGEEKNFNFNVIDSFALFHLIE